MRYSVFILLFFISILGHAQYTIRCLDLSIIPVSSLTPSALRPKEVKKDYSIKIKVKESICKPELDDFFSMISKIGSNDEYRISPDYRVRCVFCFKRRFRKKVVVYFNRAGDFLLNGKTYHNEEIKNFIFCHIPQNAL